MKAKERKDAYRRNVDKQQESDGVDSGIENLIAYIRDPDTSTEECRILIKRLIDSRIKQNRGTC